MKNKRYKIVLIVISFLFFLSLPLIHAFLFSSNTKGRITIDKVIKADFIKSDKRFVLLFFGYVGCVDVCTPFLEEFSLMYESKEFKDIKGDVEFIFVNLTPEIKEFQPELYASFFNKEFKGVYLSKKEIFNIDREFGLFFSRKLRKDDELDHSDFLYLIQNEKDKKVLKNIYSIHPLDLKDIIHDIREDDYR